MTIDDLGDDGESETDSGALRSDKGVEDRLDFVGRDAAAVIDHSDFRLSAIAARAHGHGRG